MKGSESVQKLEIRIREIRKLTDLVPDHRNEYNLGNVRTSSLAKVRQEFGLLSYITGRHIHYVP
jgi:hypothetical protein